MSIIDFFQKEEVCLFEAMNFTERVSEYHSLDVRIGRIVRFCFDCMGGVALHKPIDSYGEDCWTYMGVDTDIYSFSPYQKVRLVGIGEDIVYCEFV